MANGSPAASFTAYGNRRLRKAGVAGKRIGVACGRGSLTLTREDGVPVAWPVAALARIRVGYEETKYGKFYQTMIWLEGQQRPVILMPERGGAWAQPYATTIRALAAELAATRGLVRVERGIGGFSALRLPILIGLLFCAAMGISLFVLGNEPWRGRMLVPLAPGLILAVLVWNWLARSRPRAVGELGELERQLP